MAITSEPKLNKKIDRLIKFSENPEATILDIVDELEAKLELVKSLADNIISLDLKNGKDAKPEDVVPLVLAKLPKTETKGEDLVNKINALPLEDDKKISAEHIKDLPKGGNIVTRINNPIAIYDEGTLLTDFVREINVVGAGVQTSIIDGKITLTISGGAAANESNGELLTDSGDHINFTFANAPTGVSVVWRGETGQIQLPGSYSVVGTTLTFTSAQVDGDGNAFTIYANSKY